MFRLCFLFVIRNEIFGRCPGFVHILSHSCFFVSFSLWSYVCVCPELEISYKQGTITALIQNISFRRQGLERRKVWKERVFIIFSFFQKMESILLQIYFCDCRQGSQQRGSGGYGSDWIFQSFSIQLPIIRPKWVFRFLMFCEHLNFNS